MPDESLMGGKYHGPSNAPGLTSREYYEMQVEWDDDRFDYDGGERDEADEDDNDDE